MDTDSNKALLNGETNKPTPNSPPVKVVKVVEEEKPLIPAEEESHNDDTAVTIPPLQEVDDESPTPKKKKSKSKKSKKSKSKSSKSKESSSDKDSSTSSKDGSDKEISSKKESSNKNDKKKSSTKSTKVSKQKHVSDDEDDDDETTTISNTSDATDNCAKQCVKKSGPGFCTFLGFGLLLWITEYFIVNGLKQSGYLENDFTVGSAVKEAVRPPLEYVSNKFNTTIPLLDDSSPLNHLTKQNERVGYQLAEKGAKVNFPVIMVPGFVTSGLTVWGGKPCGRKHFRRRLWAAFNGGLSFVMDKDCWRQHMMLDPVTGMDPEGIKLRAAEGFEAADYFMANYWVFGKIIENLADIGYTTSEMSMEPYDWRLSFPLLQERDGYFTKLKMKIEATVITSKKKIVLATHSMGAQVCHYFFNWVTTSLEDGGGGGGKDWVNDHVHSYLNLAGSHLGVPKASTALLSGEMSDTVLEGTFDNIMEQFFGRVVRRELWVTWGSLWAMQLMGGNNVWGSGYDMCMNVTDSDDAEKEDLFCPKNGMSPLIALTDSNENITARIDAATKNQKPENDFNRTVREFVEKQSHSLEDTVSFLAKYSGRFGQELKNIHLHSLYEDKPQDAKLSWHDVSKTPLPNMKDVTIYCMYGTGLDTERAYYYKRNIDENVEGVTGSIQDPPIVLDRDYFDSEHKVKNGIRYTNGDGSVPLLSLGYICADAWIREESGLNPSKAKVYTREYEHKPSFSVDDPMRGGPYSADHVDILGNKEMMNDLIRIATAYELDEVNQDKISSDIKKIGEKIWQDGGLSKKDFY